MAKNIPCAKLKEMIKDEEMGVKEYRKFGLTKIANQEAKHRDYLKKLFNKKCGRGNGKKM